jgi:spore maturation protein CgeB
VTLNIGRRFNLANNKYQLEPTTPGPRTFEAAMAGGLQCVYLESLELADYFTFGEEVLVFDSTYELKVLVEELRSDKLARMRLAEKSQARAIKDHTYAARAKVILNNVRL